MQKTKYRSTTCIQVLYQITPEAECKLFPYKFQLCITINMTNGCFNQQYEVSM